MEETADRIPWAQQTINKRFYLGPGIHPSIVSSFLSDQRSKEKERQDGWDSMWRLFLGSVLEILGPACGEKIRSGPKFSRFQANLFLLFFDLRSEEEDRKRLGPTDESSGRTGRY